MKKEKKEKEKAAAANRTHTGTCMKEVQAKDVNAEAFADFFNDTMHSAAAAIPRIMTMDAQRTAELVARCKEHGKGAVVQMVRKAALSSFLNGGGRRRFLASIDWLLRPDKFRKVLEGVYDDAPVRTQTQERAEAERQRREANRAIEQQIHNELHASIAERERKAATVEEIRAILGDRCVI